MGTQINEFISHFSDREQFLNGNCYWFAFILQERFKIFGFTKIMYNPIDNHFATLIDDTLYDILGPVPISSNSPWYDWDRYQKIEPLNAERIYRDTILQISPEEYNEYFR